MNSISRYETHRAECRECTAVDSGDKSVRRCSDGRVLVAQAEIERLNIEMHRRLSDAMKCSTCGGDPKSHPSGKLCICGDGTREGEVLGLRKAFIAMQDENAGLASYEEAYHEEYERAERGQVYSVEGRISNTLVTVSMSNGGGTFQPGQKVWVMLRNEKDR